MGSTSYLQTDAAINPGGALFNHDGHVIGMNTVIETTLSRANIGLGSSVPINHVKQVVAALHQGPPSWGDADLADIISLLTPGEAEVFNVPNGLGVLVVTKTPKNGPGADELLLHDVIYSIDETGISSIEQATRLIGNINAGEQLSLDLFRDGQPMPVEVTLNEGWQAAEPPKPDGYEGYLGMTLGNWSLKEQTRQWLSRKINSQSSIQIKLTCGMPALR